MTGARKNIIDFVIYSDVGTKCLIKQVLSLPLCKIYARDVNCGLLKCKVFRPSPDLSRVYSGYVGIHKTFMRLSYVLVHKLVSGSGNAAKTQLKQWR